MLSAGAILDRTVGHEPEREALYGTRRGATTHTSYYILAIPNYLARSSIPTRRTNQMRSQKIGFSIACLLMACSAPAIACSPSSDPTARSQHAERIKGRYRFWAEVIGEEAITTKAKPLRPAARLTGLRVRILESAYAELPVSEEFTFVGAAIGADCGPDYESVPTANYPDGTEVQLGSDDLFGIRVLGFSRTALHQCPETVPAMDIKPAAKDSLETLAMPSRIPAGYSGCHYFWHRDAGSRAPMTLSFTSYFQDGHLQWYRTDKSLCTYRDGRLAEGKPVYHRCSASEVDVRKLWRLD